MRSHPSLLAATFLVPIAAGALAQPDFAFMPDGGKVTLAQLVQAGALDLNDIAGSTASEDQWRLEIEAVDASLGTKQVETLASYLAINMPMSTLRPLGELPSDGKELAIDNCQFCHSFFTGYLVHDRDTEGWRAIFKSPFHTELPMNDRERETFARYSAINMPIAYEDVPEDLRF